MLCSPYTLFRFLLKTKTRNQNKKYFLQTQNQSSQQISQQNLKSQYIDFGPKHGIENKLYTQKKKTTSTQNSKIIL